MSSLAQAHMLFWLNVIRHLSSLNKNTCETASHTAINDMYENDFCNDSFRF